ncbi:S1C family serine protease [Cohnella zeiphila]|uniref:Trypsin-like peptidase domain-containing protein n=1 Tax=Cohnella zeiphila TaxID=2761120 RepID=A0A7X0SUK0_9BACL|nr:trypsin-like peptidase domain-containing protein [Cohnella zeiphila]MBB6735419.1 trypsin-like peptidase domain-containing protein [Cohnella zeiphila]
MSFFDDDFYSTRVPRKTRRGLDRRREPSFGRSSMRQGSVFRVALFSSLVSSLLVAVLFTLFLDRGSEPRSVPALASGQPIVETSERIIDAAAKIRPAVVSVINRPKQEDGGDGADAPSGDDSLENANLGSGVIFQKKDGKALIITNAHVVADSGSVQVVMVNGDQKTAKIVGADAISDLAVLEVDDKGVGAVATLGKSSGLREGETVIAVGNPLGLSDSLTDGIVSNLNRLLPVSINQNGVYDWEEEVIQISAPINPGNSGGALVNLNGDVVGINSMKVADTGVEGIGFAIPIDDAAPIVNQLIEHGKVLRPYLGIYSMDLSVYQAGLSATQDGSSGGSDSSSDGQDEDPLVVPKGVKDGVVVLEAVGPAKDAGIQLNDIIVKLDGKPIDGMLALRKYLYGSKKIGDTLAVSLYRDGKPLELKVKLAEPPDDDDE